MITGPQWLELLEGFAYELCTIKHFVIMPPTL